MFALVWGARSDDSDLHGREQGGVEYTRALNKLLPVLVDAQSAAVAGKTATKESFSEALEAVAAVDQKYGSDFGTTNRWSGLRARIETLPEQGRDQNGAFKNYGEATDLLLALYDRVAQASGLRSDADGVISYLQDSALEELPTTIVWAGRYQDQTVIANALPKLQREQAQETFDDQLQELSNALTNLAVSRDIVGESGADVAADMAAAVDNSESGTFSTSLLQNLDEFQRGVEALAPPGQTALSRLPGVKDVTAQRASAQAAAVALSPLLLDELESQVDDRKGSADIARVLAFALLAIAVLTTVAGILLLVLSARRARAERAEAAGPAPYDPGQPDYSGYPSGPEAMGPDPYLNNLDAGRDARRERVGVPR